MIHFPTEEKVEEEAAAAAADGAETLTTLTAPTIPSTMEVAGGSYTSSKVQEAIVVDAQHPEVVEMVNQVMEIVEKQEVSLAPEVWVDCMEQAIEEAEKKTRAAGETAPL